MENASGHIALTVQALAAALPKPADGDVSGDMVGVLVHLIDNSSQTPGCKWVGSWSCEVVEKLWKVMTSVPFESHKTSLNNCKTSHIKPFHWICVDLLTPQTSNQLVLMNFWCRREMCSVPDQLPFEEFVRSSGHDSQRAIFPNGEQSWCEALEGLCILSGYESKRFLEASEQLSEESFADVHANMVMIQVLIYCKLLIMGTFLDPLEFEWIWGKYLQNPVGLLLGLHFMVKHCLLRGCQTSNSMQYCFLQKVFEPI